MKDWVVYFSETESLTVSDLIATSEPLITDQMLDLPFSLGELNQLSNQIKHQVSKEYHSKIINIHTTFTKFKW